MASSTNRAGVFLPSGAGRSYAMGRISAVFKATETKREERIPSLSGAWSRTRKALARTPP